MPTRPGRLTLVLFLFAGPASAETFVVNSTGGLGDISPGNGRCDTLWPHECTLAAAIEEAHALGGAHRIELPEGVFPGGHEIGGRFQIVGAGRGSTIIDPGGFGRAFTADDTQASLALERLTIRNGFSETGGGGIDFTGRQLTLADVHVIDCHGQAGGVRADVTDFIVNDSLIADCSGDSSSSGRHAGGLSVEATTVSAWDSTFQGNSGYEGGGLGIRWRGGQNSASIVRCTFRDNTASWQGGGLMVASGPVTIVESTFVGNDCPVGGGLAAVRRGVLTMRNCTVSGNTSARVGGGIFVNGNAARLSYSTITENTVTQPPTSSNHGGGAIAALSAVAVSHCIVAGNAAAQGTDCLHGLDVEGTSLILDDSDCQLRVIDGIALVGMEPLLGPLADNGGPTLTHALLPNSPAIDAGDFSGCNGLSGAPIVTDQTGFPRPSGGSCDLGSVEHDLAPDLDDDGVIDFDDNCPEVPNGPEEDDQADADADGRGDACDCAPDEPGSYAVPGALTLDVSRASGVLLTWTDSSGQAGAGVLHDVASAPIASLRVRGVADAACLRRGLPSTGWIDDVTLGSTYYLVRASNACGPAVGEGWGSDSSGSARPACP